VRDLHWETDSAKARSCPGRAATRNVAAQSRDPETAQFVAIMGPGYAAHRRTGRCSHRREDAALRPGHERGHQT